MLFERHKHISNSTNPAAPRHGGRCGLWKNGWGLLLEIFGSCNKLAAERNGLEGQAQLTALPFPLWFLPKSLWFPWLWAYLARNTRSWLFDVILFISSYIFYYHFFLGKWNPNFQSRISLLPVLPAPYPSPDLPETLPQRAPHCRILRSPSESVLGGLLFLSPMLPLLSFKPSVQPPQPCRDHVANTSRCCGKWHR